MFAIVLSSFIVGFLSWISIYFCLPFFYQFFVDLPNVRSSHFKPKPSGGGIVFAVLGSICCTFFGFYIPILCLPLAVLGLLDDKYNIPRRFRYLFQIFTVVLLINHTNFLDLNFVNLSFIHSLLLYFILIFIGTATINFLNFMDGLDGLLSSCMLVPLSLCFYFVSPFVLPLLTSILSFVLWNWSPSKIFMGDSGSTFLGSVFFGLLLTSPYPSTTFGIILVTSPLLGDALFSLLRRFFSNQNIFNPHKQHLFQRLNQAGYSHSQVSLLYFLATFILSISFVYGGIIFCVIMILFMFPFAFFLDQHIAVPFTDLNEF